MNPEDERMDDVNALLRTLDHPVPEITAESVAAQARAGGWGRAGAPLRWAAAIVLTLGAAGAAFAIPGSPLPGWVSTVATRLRGSTVALPADSVQVPIGDRASAGIAVAPGQALIILFVGAGADGLARVSLTDRAEVVVRASTGAATFTSGTDRLVIEDRNASDTFAVEIPRSAPRVEIRVGGTPALLAERGRIVAAGAPDSAGTYTLRLARKAP
jgi:hypothetical protein